MKINNFFPATEGIRSFLPQAPKFNTNITPKITAVALATIALFTIASIPGANATWPQWVECVQRCIESSDSPYRFTICPILCLPHLG